MEAILSEHSSNWWFHPQATMILLAASLSSLIFYTDSLTPLGFAHATLYIAPLMLICPLGGPRLMSACVLVFAVLAVMGYFLSPNGIDREIASANRIASVGAMIAVAVAARGAQNRR